MRILIFLIVSISLAGCTQDRHQEDIEAKKAAYFQQAEQGDAHGQFNLGVIYEEGKGVSQDDTQAVSWYRKAAEQGYARAQTNLGRMFKKGRGVSQDDKEAVSWYRKAAEQGDASAQTNLG
ncbi:tetratricopeptide repeat protein, partial [Vibrio splendidus]